MNRKIKPDARSNKIFDITDMFKEMGSRIGHNLYRIIIYEDGRGEAEFETRNPIECLVIRWEDCGELPGLFNVDNQTRPISEKVIVRKKCVRCFMHERKVGQGDV